MDKELMAGELVAAMAGLARPRRARKMEPAMRKFASFSQFSAFYLGEHTKPTTRRLHFFGSAVGLICLLLLGVTRNPWWLAAALFAGYGLAWFSHFVFEKNRPATFRQPLFS